MTNTNNEPLHSDLTQILNDIKQCLGIVLVAEAGHGKSFTAFSIVKEALKDPNLTVIVMSPSSIWRRNYGSINCVKVGTYEFNPIIANDKADVEAVNFLRDTVHINLDKKWTYVKSTWLESLLRSKQSLLFDIKYKNGRRIKAFETVVLEFLYDMQSAEIDRNPKYKHHYLIVLEEIQNCFGTYSMNADDSLELFTVFTQSRSDANLHYIAIGQRLNDISCKVVERLRPLIGLTLGENSLRKLKAMIPDEQTKKRIQSLPKRHWIYLNGTDNPEIEIPEYYKEGHVTYLKPITEQPKSKPTLAQRFKKWLNGEYYKQPTEQEIQEAEELEQEAKESEIEDSQGDGLMEFGEPMFPEEIE
jgi:hypothetical protein